MRRLQLIHASAFDQYSSCCEGLASACSEPQHCPSAAANSPKPLVLQGWMGRGSLGRLHTQELCALHTAQMSQRTPVILMATCWSLRILSLAWLPMLHKRATHTIAGALQKSTPWHRPPAGRAPFRRWTGKRLLTSAAARKMRKLGCRVKAPECLTSRVSRPPSCCPT